MTDITGNFSVNKTPYTKENQKKELCPECGRMCNEDSEIVPDINLDYDPAVVIGKAMIKTSKANGNKQYEFKKENVENDVKTLQMLADLTQSTINGYMAKGLSRKEAEEKAMLFIDALLSQNIGSKN